MTEAELAARELVSRHPPDGVAYARLRLGPHENFVYVFADLRSKTAACIDPAFDVARLRKLLGDWGVNLVHVLHTHNHWDHIEGTQELMAAPEATDATGYIHLADAAPLANLKTRLQKLSGGERLVLGTDSIHVHATPGHTAGGLTYAWRGRLFTGDLLFAETAGRCDFPTGSKEAMWDSLQYLKASFPDDALVCPGHDYGTLPEVRLGDAKRSNPALAHTEFGAFSTEWFLKAY